MKRGVIHIKYGYMANWMTKSPSFDLQYREFHEKIHGENKLRKIISLHFAPELSGRNRY